MVISYATDGTVVAKAKNATLSLGSTIKIDSFVISGPGEYDVASVHCEAAHLQMATTYWFRTEDLSIVLLTQPDASVVKHSASSNTDILVVELRSDDTPDLLKPILKALEPAYLFLIGAGATPEFAAGLGLPKYESATLKVSKASLPMEGTFLVLPD